MKKILIYLPLFIFTIILVKSISASIISPEIVVEKTMCTMEFMPVCAEVSVQCIKAPCPKKYVTFSNKCHLQQNKLAKFLYNGECKETDDDPLGINIDPEYKCIPGYKQKIENGKIVCVKDEVGYGELNKCPFDEKNLYGINIDCLKNDDPDYKKCLQIASDDLKVCDNVEIKGGNLDSYLRKSERCLLEYSIKIRACADKAMTKKDRERIVEYVKNNISEISNRYHIKEVLGGKFYVTSFKWVTKNDLNLLIVSYEDGHNAYTANVFAFINLEDKKSESNPYGVKVDSFYLDKSNDNSYGNENNQKITDVKKPPITGFNIQKEPQPRNVFFRIKYFFINLFSRNKK